MQHKELIARAEAYLSQLAPHIKAREAAKLIAELVAALRLTA